MTKDCKCKLLDKTKFYLSDPVIFELKFIPINITTKVRTIKTRPTEEYEFIDSNNKKLGCYSPEGYIKIVLVGTNFSEGKLAIYIGRYVSDNRGINPGMIIYRKNGYGIDHSTYPYKIEKDKLLEIYQDIYCQHGNVVLTQEQFKDLDYITTNFNALAGISYLKEIWGVVEDNSSKNCDPKG